METLEDRRLLSATLAVSASQLILNAVHGSTSSQTLTLSDTGNADLTISSFTVAADTSLPGETSGAGGASLFSVSGASTPLTIPAGTSATITVTYAPTTYSLDAASLQIASNDPANATDTVPLRGIGTNGLSGGGQPSLLRILEAYDIPTQVGETDATNPYYPEPPAGNSQEVTLQRLAKAGPGPVTITPLASFTSSGSIPFILGTYTPGNTNATSELYHTLSTEYQTVNLHAQGATQFDPGSASFGFYFVSGGHTAYSEDQFNSYDTTDMRKFRFFPMENPDGTTVPNTYILTATEYFQPAGYDFTNMVAIVSNVMAAPRAPSAPNLGVIDPFALPGSNTVIFNKIVNPNSTLGDVVHNTDTLTLDNTGGSTLTISSYQLSTGWQLVSAPAFPLAIAAGSSTTLTLQFIATAEPAHAYNQTDSTTYPNDGGVYNGALTLNSNDPNSPTTSVNLAAWRQLDSENQNEPSFQTIANLLIGWGTNINPTPIPTLSETLATGASPTYYGEEVVSGYWQEANPAAGVNVEQIAAYHTEGANSNFSWYTQGSSSYHQLFNNATDDGQTLFPNPSGGMSPETGSFSSSGVFGFKTDTEFSDDSKNPQGSAGGHDVRFFPIRNSAGVIVPNTYLVTMDYYTTQQNFDFQDNVYVISNIRPAAQPPTPADVKAVSNTSNVSLQWAPAVYANLAGYNVSRSTSLNGTYTLLTSSPITSASYIDSSPPTSGTLYYKITAVDNSSGVQSVAGNAVTSHAAAPAPVANPDYLSAETAQPTSLDVLANDTGTPVVSSVAISTPPDSGGTVSVDPSTGMISYTSAAGFTGTETFAYTFQNSSGVTSSPAVVSVSVTPVPTGPETVADTYSDVSGQSATLNVLANDTDPTATIDPTTVAISTAPDENGTAVVTATTGEITYTPATHFSGTETFYYTVADSNGLISQPTLVTVNVTNPNAPPTALNDTATTTQAVAVNINVLANDVSTTALNPATVTIGSAPVDGTAFANSDGTITYTPHAGFLGADRFTYTVANTAGQVSNLATVTVNVHAVVIPVTTVKIGSDSGDARSVTLTDADGTTATIRLNRGTAEVKLTGQVTVTTDKHGNDSISGSGVTIASIVLDDASSSSVLTVRGHGGDGMIAIGAITGPAITLHAINAPAANLTGSLSIAGVNNLKLSSASSAQISIGSGGSSSVAIVIGSLTNTLLSSDQPIRVLRVDSWTDTTAGTSTLSAPSIGNLIDHGDFAPAITTTSGGLNGANINSTVDAAAWTIAGDVHHISAGAVAAGFSANISGQLNNFVAHGGGFAGDLSAGQLGAVHITGDLTGTINSTSARLIRATGNAQSATIALTGSGVSLNRLVINGTVNSTSITTADDLANAVLGGLVDSTLDIGATSGTTVANGTAGSGGLNHLRVNGTFAGSDVVAGDVRNISLGNVDTSNGGTPDGVLTTSLKSITATFGSTRLHVPAKQTTDNATLQAYLQSTGIVFGDFVIEI